MLPPYTLDGRRNVEYVMDRGFFDDLPIGRHTKGFRLMEVHGHHEASVLLLATMDTKGPEVLYLRDRLRGLGAEPLLMDLSMGYGDPVLSGGHPGGEVAEAGGKQPWSAVSGSRDMAANMET